MTHYHGAECGSVVFTGFDLWTWARADCRQLVDAVLQGAWGLQRSAEPATRTRGAAIARR